MGGERPVCDSNVFFEIGYLPSLYKQAVEMKMGKEALDKIITFLYTALARSRWTTFSWKHSLRCWGMLG